MELVENFMVPVPVSKPVPGDPEISKNIDSEVIIFFYYENLIALLLVLHIHRFDG